MKEYFYFIAFSFIIFFASFGLDQANALPIARFDWDMGNRFGNDRNGDGLIDYDYSDEYINPPNGFAVHFDGCFSRGIESRISSYQWRIEGNGILVERTETYCYMRQPVSLPLGNYSVTLTVTTAGGLSNNSTKTVPVKDILIVSIGDSYASGEGNPDKPQRFSWWGGVSEGPKWEDRICHRSANAGPAKAALELERSDHRTSVTFLSYACSGATINSGLIGRDEGIEPQGIDRNNDGLYDDYIRLDPQTWQVARDICRATTNMSDPVCLNDGRTIDYLLISVGGEDIGFTEIIFKCALDIDCYNDPVFVSNIAARFVSLPNLYFELAHHIQTRFKASNILITEYPDPTHDERGNYCTTMLGAMNYLSIRWAYENIITRLNQEVHAAAERHNWTYVGGIASDSKTHGYCAGDQRWFRTISDSRVIQGPFCCPWESKGTMHPNIEGHLNYKNHILQEIDNTILPPINELSLRVEPSTIIAKLRTSVVVHAEDANNQTRVNGTVIIDNVVVGKTNVAFNHTFNRSSVYGKVTAPNYPEVSFQFNINNKLDVRAIPNTISFSEQRSPTNITIIATSPATHQPIEGKVLTNEGRAQSANQEIGPTNVPFLHYFRPHTEGTPQRGFTYYAPEVIVVAPTYDNTPVQIEFTDIPEPTPGPDSDGPDGPDDDDECLPGEMRPACP
jgi:hypothetical protein